MIQITFTIFSHLQPLNSAVQFGNLYAVELCLEHGAKISEVNANQLTAVHTACAQGSLDILHLMHSKQPELFMELMYAEDSNEMTPLHKAVGGNFQGY